MRVDPRQDRQQDYREHQEVDAEAREVHQRHGGNRERARLGAGERGEAADQLGDAGERGGAVALELGLARPRVVVDAAAEPAAEEAAAPAG